MFCAMVLTLRSFCRRTGESTTRKSPARCRRGLLVASYAPGSARTKSHPAKRNAAGTCDDPDVHKHGAPITCCTGLVKTTATRTGQRLCAVAGLRHALEDRLGIKVRLSLTPVVLTRQRLFRQGPLGRRAAGRQGHEG